MSCILCLSASDRMFYIFDEIGMNLNIGEIITKHFWLKPNAEDDNSKFICSPCWNTVESFHTFYKSIEDAHAVLTTLLKLPDNVSDNEDESFSDLLSTVVKQENCDETEFESPEIPTVILTEEGTEQTDKQEMLKFESDTGNHRLKTRSSSVRSSSKEEGNSDSESDSTDDSNDNRDDNNDHHQDVDSESGSDYTNSKTKKAKSTYSTKTYEPGKGGLHRKDFDSYIKKNMELLCELCSKSLKNFAILKEHFRTAHKTDGYVKCCERHWTTRFSLVHHLLHHQNPDLFKCPKCARVLSTKRSFRNHLKTHVVQEPIHKCTQCKKSFTSIPRLQKHLKTHEKNRDDSDQICDQCGKVYHSKQVLRVHQKRDHFGLMKPKQRVQCQECGVYLAEESTLKFHMKHLHPTVKVVHKCSICGKISATGYGLKRHMQYMHTMGRVHKCTICEDKAFKTAQRLREHMTTHTGEVLYTCPHCPKTFNSNANMHSHRKKMHRKEWEENRRHPHLGTSANAKANAEAAAAAAAAAAAEENNQQ